MDNYGINCIALRFEDEKLEDRFWKVYKEMGFPYALLPWDIVADVNGGMKIEERELNKTEKWRVEMMENDVRKVLEKVKDGHQ